MAKPALEHPFFEDDSRLGSRIRSAGKSARRHRLVPSMVNCYRSDSNRLESSVRNFQD
jgi:hypothetical protein